MTRHPRLKGIVLSEILSFHAFRRGAGTSSLVASTAGLLAAQGKHVGIVDADLQSPSAHILFGLNYASIGFTLADYLSGACPIAQTVYDVTSGLGAPVGGRVWLVPGSSDPLKIMHLLRQGYEVTRLTEAFTSLIQDFALDYLLIDASAGINDETLASLAIADALVLILRLDQQDYQGTAVLLEIARRMGTARLLFVVNDVPSAYNPDEVSKRVAETYHLAPDFILRHSDEMLALASRGIFSLQYPNHPLTQIMIQLTARLTGQS